MDAIRFLSRKLRWNQRGATAIEYGLIAALIAVAAIGGMTKMGGGANGMWGRIQNSVNSM